MVVRRNTLIGIMVAVLTVAIAPVGMAQDEKKEENFFANQIVVQGVQRLG